MQAFQSTFVGVVNSLQSHPVYQPSVKGTRVSCRNVDPELGGTCDVIIPLGESVPSLGTEIVISTSWTIDEAASDGQEGTEEGIVPPVSITDVSVQRGADGA